MLRKTPANFATTKDLVHKSLFLIPITKMKKIILLFMLGLFVQNAFAQRITLKGIVADSSNTALPFVTVTLLKPTDSTLVHFASTEEDGSFEFKNIPSESLVMRISYVGFQPYLQNVAGKESQDFGTIKLQPIMLKEVILKGEKEPITIKKDIVEYNAGSFKVRPNSSVEELLKKLPGVEVDSEGNVKAQGQNVQKVLVNGKEFFGNDPKTATKNLPADAIEKIQVFDKKSDQAVFSGIDDGEKTKTINLETKNKDKQMSFGKLMAGGGIDEASKGRYEGKANFNTFKNQNQFSLIGMGNNINQSGFSFSDYFEFMGGMNGMRGGGGGGARMMTFDSESMNSLPFAINGFGGGGNFGFLRNVAGGINLNRKINKDLEMNGSYFLTHANNRIDKTQYSENFLPNTVYASNQTTNQWADNLNHRLNLTLDYKIDSLNSLKLTTSGSLADNNARVNSFVRTLLNNETLQNENQRDNNNLSQTLNYNVSLLFRHRFKKKGRTFSTTLGTTGNDQNQEGTLVSNNAFFFPIPSAILLNQENEQRTFAQTYSAKSSYTEPLGKKIYWELNHQYQRNENESNREVFDVLGEQRILNSAFSNSFDNTFQYNRIGTNLKINRKKYNVTVGAGGQFSDLKGVLNNGLDVGRKFNNFLPNASFDYAFSQTRNFRVDYSTSVREPSVQQLQPVVNNTDPLNIALGNPDLRPQYFHRGSINYTRFNPSNFSNFFTFFNVNYTANSIVTSQTIDPIKFIRTTQPVNTRGTFILSNFTNTGFRVNKLKSRFNFGVNTTYNRSINLLNNVESFIHQTSLGGSFRYEFNIEEKFDISLSANLTHQTTNYDFNATQNQRFLNETYTANTNVSFSKRAWATANFNYMIYKSLTNNFYQEMPLLNLSFSALVLPNGKGELKLSVVNALNQNVGVTQNANANSLQQETIQSLGRYAMLSFTYSLSQISNPIQNKQNTRRMMFGN
jgi:hypothetical protein